MWHKFGFNLNEFRYLVQLSKRNSHFYTVPFLVTLVRPGLLHVGRLCLCWFADVTSVRIH